MLIRHVQVRIVCLVCQQQRLPPTHPNPPPKLLGEEEQQKKVICGHRSFSFLASFPACGIFMLSKHTNLGTNLIVLSCLMAESGFQRTFNPLLCSCCSTFLTFI